MEILKKSRKNPAGLSEPTVRYEDGSTDTALRVVYPLSFGARRGAIRDQDSWICESEWVVPEGFDGQEKAPFRKFNVAPVEKMLEKKRFTWEQHRPATYPSA